MNLLKEFRAQLATLGKLEVAWFTSFNSNIEFIETYLLPAVLDADPPRNRLDYEHFQLTLTLSSLPHPLPSIALFEYIFPLKSHF